MTARKPQTATLIDTLSEGYAAVNRRPWLLGLPVALNLYLAFGARLSFAPLLASLGGLVQRIQPAGADPAVSQDMANVLEALGQVDMRAQLASLNFIPTLPPVSMQGADTIVISSVGGALLAFALINALALPLSALFLVLTARAVRGEATRPGLARDVGRTALAILAYIAVIAIGGLALGLPYMVLSGLLMWLSPAVGVLAVIVLQLLIFWAWIYIGFTNEAIVMGGQGPLQAIRASFNLVRHNFWGTLGFLGLSAFVIPLGLGVVWQMIAGSPVGLAAAAVGSAYIGCGLAAARMVFYRERIRRWQGAPAYVRTGR
ncbi:MAG TPA: hypothetical protein VNL77_10605 [Roseiflexaceae bacterium]|nr:hypothetical protein [Roseiflexaceae bacterium]